MGCLMCFVRSVDRCAFGTDEGSRVYSEGGNSQSNDDGSKEQVSAATSKK